MSASPSLGLSARAEPPKAGKSRHRRRSEIKDGVVAVAVVAPAIVVMAAIVHFAGATAAIALAVGLIALVLVSRVRSDVAGALIVLVLALLLIPARLRIAPLHAAGTPGSLIGIAAFLSWLYGRLLGRPWLARGSQPLRWAFGVLAVSVLASYLAMDYRTHTVAEDKGGDRGILLLLSMTGIALLAADGISTRDRLRRVIEALVVGGTIAALLGFVQFETGVDYAARVRLPGFTYVATPYSDGSSGSASRSGFSRIVGTTTHPIEFSVLLVVLFGLALHLVLTSPPGRRQIWICCAAVLAVTIPMTVSRSAVIAFAALLIVLAQQWSLERRVNALFLLVLGTGAMRLAVPGLIGTLQSLFTDSQGDPSRQSRSAGFDFAVRLIAQRPWLGRGFGTFLPDQYTYLDDQILLTVVETGFIGLLAVVVLWSTAAWTTREVRRLSPNAADRDLAQTLLGCALATFATAFTYDFFSFPTILAVAMLTFGLGGALLRIVRTESTNLAGRNSVAATGSHR